jgi:hypothetical protein
MAVLKELLVWAFCAVRLAMRLSCSVKCQRLLGARMEETWTLFVERLGRVCVIGVAERAPQSCARGSCFHGFVWPSFFSHVPCACCCGGGFAWLKKLELVWGFWRR